MADNDKRGGFLAELFITFSLSSILFMVLADYSSFSFFIRCNAFFVFLSRALSLLILRTAEAVMTRRTTTAWAVDSVDRSVFMLGLLDYWIGEKIDSAIDFAKSFRASHPDRLLFVQRYVGLTRCAQFKLFVLPWETDLFSFRFLFCLRGFALAIAYADLRLMPGLSPRSHSL